MKYSGIAGYKRLREIDPELCQKIVETVERVLHTYRLDPSLSSIWKQEICQLALDTLVRNASRTISEQEVK